MSDEAREFPNPFPDFSARSDLTKDGFETDFQPNLLECQNRLRKMLEKHPEEAFESSDNSVYTGTCGVAYLYWRMSNLLPTEAERRSAFDRSLRLVQDALDRRKGKRVTFLCGDAGPLALGAVLFHRGGDEKESRRYITELCSLSRKVVRDDDEMPDELLYGRVGYLYALLFVLKHGEFSATTAAEVKSVVVEVVDAVLRSGQRAARAERTSHSPLMFQWHEKHYVGAAHGIAGICAMLLQAAILLPEDLPLKAKVEAFIVPTLDYVCRLRFPSGNFPSSLESSSKDKLVHWCHGSPGVLYSLLFAHRLFGQAKYLEMAVECGEVIWRRGILRKGYGICHGVAGNAYGLVSLYRATGDRKYAYRASAFAKWIFDYGKHRCRTPDRPYSLFEGLAGTLLFLYEMNDLDEARFPAFDLT